MIKIRMVLAKLFILCSSSFLSIAITTVLIFPQASFSSSINHYFKLSALQNSETDADQLYKKASQLWSQGSFQEALPILEKALVIFRKIDSRKKIGDVLTGIGVVHDNLGNYDYALDYLKQALTIRRSINDRFGESRTLNNIGLVFDHLGELNQSINYLQQALVIVQERHDRPMAGVTLNNIGAVYTKQGQYSRALKCYQQALTNFRAVQDRFGEGTSLRNLGEVYEISGQYAKALQYYEQALTVVQNIGDRFGEGNTLNKLGDINNSLGQYDQALKQYNLALTIRQSLGDRPLVGVTLNSIGKVYSNQRQYKKALFQYEQALAIFRFLSEFPQEERTLNKIGEMYKKVMIDDRALSYFQRALSIRGEVGERPMKWIVLNNIGEVQTNLKQYSQALDSYQKALAIVHRAEIRPGEWLLLSNLGKVYEKQGQYSQALEYYQLALNVVQRLGDLAGKGAILNNIGKLYLKQNEYASAEATLFDAIQALESLRPGLTDVNKVSIFERQASSYRLLQQTLIAQKKINNALEISERGRARAFVELLASKLLDSPKNKISIEPLNIEQIQKIAKEQNSTLIEYSLIPNDIEDSEGPERKSQRTSNLYIWVIKPSGEIVFEQTDFKLVNLSLEQLVASSRISLGVRSRGPSIEVETNEKTIQAEHLQNLSRLLVQPISAHLPTDPYAHIIIVPQGELFLVPFAALPDMDGKKLIENHTILTAPAIQVLALTHQQRLQLRQKKLSEALVVGNPVMPQVTVKLGEPSRSLSSLFGAEQEAIKIARILSTKAFIGQQATKRSIVTKLPQARVIHLATHGLLDDYKGLGTPGAIALGPSGTGELNDGLLTANEILDLNLNAELVVLSACDTGRGRITGDGVIGLSRSLITAGVPSVIVSLWSVPDAPTAELMVEFYRNWQERRMDKAQALRQAMLTTIKTHPNPRDWAAFTLIGEPE